MKDRKRAKEEMTMQSKQELRQAADVSGFCEATGKHLGRISPEGCRDFEALRLGIRYPAGAALFFEGESARGVYVVSKGRVKISVASGSGKVLILRIARPGDILGLHAVISNVAYQATAETLEPCEVDFVRADDFQHFLRRHPQAALQTARQLSGIYQETCRQLRALGLSASAREKVARFLVEWSEHGEVRKDGIRTRLTLTHEEIGQLTGASRETVTRIFGDFRNRGWVSVRGSFLLLRNKTALTGLIAQEGADEPRVRSTRSVENHQAVPAGVPSMPPYVQPDAYSPTVRPAALHG